AGVDDRPVGRQRLGAAVAVDVGGGRGDRRALGGRGAGVGVRRVVARAGPGDGADQRQRGGRRAAGPDEAAGGAGGPTVVRAVRPGRPRLVGLGTARTRPRVPPGRRGGQRQRDRALAGVVLGGRPRVPRRAGVLVGGCPGVFVGGCPGVLVGGCPGVFVGVRVAVDLVPLRDGGRSGPGAGADRGRPALVLGRHVG